MFVVRQATVEDHAALIKLTRMVHAGDGAPGADEIARRIVVSRDSFAGRNHDIRDRRFIFVLEDSDTGTVAGMSALRSSVSRPGEPRTFLEVRRREHYSEDLQTGHVHMTLQVGTDDRETSEALDLVVAPPYRGSHEHLGAFVSLARFHFIGLHRDWFADRIVAELRPPQSAHRRHALWEHLGRRFINLSRAEAERFRTHSREFIAALMPREEIYASLLPPEARNLIGKVDAAAAPARATLERLGFEFAGRIEPFGGGPILEARLDDIRLVGLTRKATLGDPAKDYPLFGLVSIEGPGKFRAVRSSYCENGDRISIPGEAAGFLSAQVGDTVGLTALS